MTKIKDEIVKKAFELYMQGLSLREIATRIKQLFNTDVHFSSIARWAKQYGWELKRKQKAVLEIEETQEDLETEINLALDKAEKLDYKDLCELQERYKKFALERYAPRAVEIVIQCIRMKREIREGLRVEEDKKVVVELIGLPRKGEGWGNGDQA